MNLRLVFPLLACFMCVALANAAAQVPPANPEARPAQATATSDQAIDFARARQLMQRRRNGEKLSAEEEAFVRKAQAAYQIQRNSATGQGDAGPIVPREKTGLVPLTEMSADQRYKGEDGGLYGKGQNVPPPSHRLAAEKELKQIQPVDANGDPDPNGWIGFISISMSNATQEFSRFKQIADKEAEKSPRVKIVDCAQGGQAMAEWVQTNAPPWSEAERRLKNAQLAPKQVQVAWIKIANKQPSGDLAEHGRRLERDTAAVIRNAKLRFPNLRIVYLSSRIYGGYTSGRLNPEPYAYESAFVVRWLIEAQIRGDADLNYDASRGEVRAPLLVWGPYLWADGTTPRKSDQLVYTRDDLARDGTHPSEAGRDKVARQLLDFFKTDALAKSWFALAKSP